VAWHFSCEKKIKLHAKNNNADIERTKFGNAMQGPVSFSRGNALNLC
jgi:hypothetical protein